MSFALPEAAVQRVLDECRARIASYETTDEPTWRRLLQELEEAVPSAPAHMRADVYSYIGACQFRLGDHQRSLDAHLEAARLQPFMADHQNNIACDLLALGRPSEALEQIRRALALPTLRPHIEASLRVNEVFAFIKLGDRLSAGKAFEMGVRRVGHDDQRNLLNLTEAAAALGRVNDCAEMLARFFSVRGQVPRSDDQPAADFIRDHFMDELAAVDPPLRDVVRAVLARWEAPTPVEYQDRANVELDPEAWARFCDLAGLMSEP